MLWISKIGSGVKIFAENERSAMETCTYFKEVSVKFLSTVTQGRQHHFFLHLFDEYEGSMIAKKFGQNAQSEVSRYQF